MIKETVVKKTAEWLLDVAVKSYRSSLETRKLKRAISNFYTRLSNLRKVHTIWSGDKEIDISTIYVPPKVYLSDKTLVFKDLASFPLNDNLVIMGIAGEGKSTLMKMLCTQMIDYNECLPVFIELRRIKKTETIINHAIQFIDIMGGDVSSQLFHYLLDNERVVIFLDAFDELSEELREDITNEVHLLTQKYSSIRFLLSTRPGTNAEYLQNFKTVKLAHLQGDDYLKVVDRLCQDDKDYKTQLINDIKCSGFNASQILKTPLMVTILVMVHQALGKLPTTLPSYYELLFDVLLSRHDDIKITCRRKRSSSLNDEEMRKCFDALSYELTRVNYGPYSKEIALHAASKAITTVALTCSPEHVLKDLKSITSLIAEEGNEYNYIHNTIREYFAASYIKSRLSGSKQKFYNAVLKDPLEATKWRQTLRFLSEIDQYYYSLYYKKVLIDRFLEYEEASIDNFVISDKMIQRLSNYYPINIRIINKDSIKPETSLIISINLPIDDIHYGKLFKFAEADFFESKRKLVEQTQNNILVSWEEAWLIPEVKKEMSTCILEIVSELINERNEIKDLINKQNSILASQDAFDI